MMGWLRNWRRVHVCDGRISGTRGGATFCSDSLSLLNKYTTTLYNVAEQTFAISDRLSVFHRRLLSLTVPAAQFTAKACHAGGLLCLLWHFPVAHEATQHKCLFMLDWVVVCRCNAVYQWKLLVHTAIALLCFDEADQRYTDLETFSPLWVCHSVHRSADLYASSRFSVSPQIRTTHETLSDSMA